MLEGSGRELRGRGSSRVGACCRRRELRVGTANSARGAGRGAVLDGVAVAQAGGRGQSNRRGGVGRGLRGQTATLVWVLSSGGDGFVGCQA